MKISQLLPEAIENPKGPAKIPTGAGKTALDNPAHSDTAYYEGNPEQFDFGAQKRNYTALKAALARSGKQFNYIAVARSPLGRDTFIATAPGVLWYKYESGSPQSGQNILYVNGVKTKTTDFIAKTPEQQAAMLVADPAHIKLEKRDAFGFLSTIAKSDRTAEQILAEITPYKDLILQIIAYQLQHFPKETAKLQTVNKLLAKKSALPQWLVFDTVRQAIQPTLANSIVNNLDTIASYAFDRLKDYTNAGLITTYDYIHREIDQKFNNIINQVKRQIIMSHISSVDNLFEFLEAVGYKTDRIDVNTIARSLSVSELERMIRPGSSNQTGNLTKMIQDWLQLGVPKEKIIAAFNEQKDQLIGQGILELARTGKAEFANNTIKSIKLLGMEWPEFATENIVKLIQDKKDVIVRTMLTNVKQNSDSVYQLEIVSKTVNFLKSVGIAWPELAAIEKSVNSMLQSRSLRENTKPKGRPMKISEVTQLDEDLGNLAQLGVGPLIKILNQPFSRGGSGRRASSPHIGAVGAKFYSSGDGIGTRSPIVDLGVIKRDVLKEIRKFFKKEEGAKAFALYIGGTPVLFATTDDYQLAGTSRISRAAYNLTPFEEEYKAHIEATYAKYQSRPSIKTAREKTEREYKNNWSDSYDVIKHYQGDVFTTSELANVIAIIEAVAKAVNKPITAKAVMHDRESAQLHYQRYQNKPEPRIRDAYTMAQELRVRLARYKNTKRPTVDTIEEFIKLALNGGAKVVNFAGHPYQMATTSYDKIEPAALLSGKPFRVSYKSNDPQDYRTVDVHYMFDRETNMLLPFKADWKSSDEGPYGASQTAVLDIKGYLRTEMKIPSVTKERVLPALLKMYKDSPNTTTYRRVLSIIAALRKAGEDWPELAAIEKSAKANLAAEK
jgi:hypothetical protein